MLTLDNLPQLLTTLGFEQQGKVYRKLFGVTALEVNFTKQEIVYPEAAGLVANERPGHPAKIPLRRP